MALIVLKLKFNRSLLFSGGGWKLQTKRGNYNFPEHSIGVAVLRVKNNIGRKMWSPVSMKDPYCIFGFIE